MLDNYGAHKTPTIRKWLDRHPRFHLHFVPTSSPRLNLLEVWFGEFTMKKIRRGTNRSVRQLPHDIKDRTDHEQNPAAQTSRSRRPTRSFASSPDNVTNLGRTTLARLSKYANTEPDKRSGPWRRLSRQSAFTAPPTKTGSASFPT